MTQQERWTFLYCFCFWTILSGTQGLSWEMWETVWDAFGLTGVGRIQGKLILSAIAPVPRDGDFIFWNPL